MLTKDTITTDIEEMYANHLTQNRLVKSVVSSYLKYSRNEISNGEQTSFWEAIRRQVIPKAVSISAKISREFTSEFSTK